jgi:protein translocase SecG subunit
MAVLTLIALILWHKSDGLLYEMSPRPQFGGRGQANVISRSIGVIATIFFLTSIALTLLPVWERRTPDPSKRDGWTEASKSSKIKLKSSQPSSEASSDSNRLTDAGSKEKEQGNVFDKLPRAQNRRNAVPPPFEAPRIPSRGQQ